MFYKKKKFKKENEIRTMNIIKIGVFDSLNSIIGTLATPYLSIIVMTITDKLTLPLMMLASFIILKRRYLNTHYLGVFLTIYGILEAFVPDFQNNQDNKFIWIMLYALSLFPGIASYIAKEIFLKNDENYSIIWLNAWISLWQFLFGLLTFPILFIPLPEPAGNHIKFNQLGSYFVNATKCQFAGINSNDDDDCNISLLYLFIYQIINTIINILMFLIIREGSSVNFIIVNALKSPITAWIGSYDKIVGSHAQKITAADFFSFIIIFLGSIIYNDKPEINGFAPIIEEETNQNFPIDSNEDSDLSVSLYNDFRDSQVVYRSIHSDKSEN